VKAIDPRGTRVVLEGDGYVVIDKPPGVLSVPGKGEENQRSAVSWCRERFPNATGPIVVHRLDMDTSGLLVLALNASVQRALSMQFEARSVEKAYVAVVLGRVASMGGVVDLPMRADIEHRPMQIVDHRYGRSAVTRFAVLGFEPDATWLRLEPITGRTHQLRVHCAARCVGGLASLARGGAMLDADDPGHPIMGDVLYGPADAPHSWPRLMLHASELAFDDPTTGRRVRVAVPPRFSSTKD
jgi:tRNA pseudouridine32 synthase / 23S rRNA pseudouridine746 synthase